MLHLSFQHNISFFKKTHTALNLLFQNRKVGARAYACAPRVNALILAVLFADGGHFVNYIVNIQNHLHHLYLLAIYVRIEFRLYFRLAHMIHPESQLDSCQRTCESGVTIGDGLGSETGSLALSSTQKNNNVLGAILLGQGLYAPLILKVHCTGGRSDKALRRGEDNICTCALSAQFDSLSGNAVTVTDYDDLLAS